jgi:hypothetical protein
MSGDTAFICRLQADMEGDGDQINADLLAFFKVPAAGRRATGETPSK